MKNKEEGFVIFGRVVSKGSGVGIPNLWVKAVDKDLLFDDVLGTAVTNEQGAFLIRYDGEDFQELFFDKRPDIYLTIKNAAGDLLYSSKDKVRYQADRTEEFLIELPGKRSPGLPDVMPGVNWNVEASNELKMKIAADEPLMRDLSKAITTSLTKHKIDLSGLSYIFEPRVFEVDPKAAPMLIMESKKAMTQRLISDLFSEDPTFSPSTSLSQLSNSAKQMRCLPECGPIDPRILQMLRDFRIPSKEIADDPVPVHIGQVEDDPVPIHPALRLMRAIISNTALLNEMSTSIFGLLEKKNISFEANQGCVFTPVVFETPVYAQQIGEFRDLDEFVSDSNPLPPAGLGPIVHELKGFGPQVFGPSFPLPPPGNVGLLKFPMIDPDHFVPVAKIKFWWWIGIPAPEMLRALDIMKQYQTSTQM